MLRLFRKRKEPPWVAESPEKKSVSYSVALRNSIPFNQNGKHAPARLFLPVRGDLFTRSRICDMVTQMHELAIAQNILDIAEDELARHNCTKLTLLRVEIGAISGVMVDALEFGLQCLVKGTPHESAVFDIVRVPLRLRCGSCGKEFEGDAGVGALSPCPDCGEVLGHSVLSGKELRVTWIEGN